MVSPAAARPRRWARALWPLAVGGLIVFGSSRPTVASPDVTEFDDKIAHFGAYGLLATLVCRIGFGGGGWRTAAWSLLAVSAFGASDEWHQSFVPGRFAGVDDWIADTLGAAVAAAAYAGWTWYRELLERPLWRRAARAKEIPAEI